MLPSQSEMTLAYVEILSHFRHLFLDIFIQFDISLSLETVGVSMKHNLSLLTTPVFNVRFNLSVRPYVPEGIYSVNCMWFKQGFGLNICYCINILECLKCLKTA